MNCPQTAPVPQSCPGYRAPRLEGVRHLLGMADLSDSELESLTHPATAVAQPQAVRTGATLALLFQQPSLRTMGSFVAAGARLGLTPLAVTTTGTAVRESIDHADELQQLSLISACVVSRSSARLSPALTGRLKAPLINAGDGTNEHPTQALLDLTVLRGFGLEGAHVVLMGNLLGQRVPHSLVQGLARLGARVTLLSPPQMGMPLEYLYKAPGARVQALTTVADSTADDVLSTADYVYVCPLVSYLNPRQELLPAFCMNLARARRVLKPAARVLHPFPRHGELSADLDGTAFDAYTEQTALGPLVRERVLRHFLTAL